MTQYYKVLSADGLSIHGGDLQWSLPTLKKDGTYKPGRWHTITGEVVVCRNGIHLTTEPGRWYTKDCVCYAAEGKGASDNEGDKTAFRSARLLHPVAHPQWWIDALAFIATIPDVPFLKPDGNPLPEWKLFTAPTLAAARDAARAAVRAATWDATWAAASAAARDAASAAAWAAASAAARDAASAAARDAARDATWDAAWDATWAAARAAGLYNQVVNICADLKLDEKHIEHAKASWQVWQKGYCLLCDMNGVLYVYAAEEATS